MILEKAEILNILGLSADFLPAYPLKKALNI
jgi:hypothetical protein